MLERHLLLVQRGERAGVLAIMDADTRAPLGSARFRSRAHRPWWRRWGRAVLDVHEAEDNPLVFSVRRLWTWRPHWEVRDAEGNPVGYLLGREVLNRYGRPWAVPLGENGTTEFQGLQGQHLALVTPAPPGLQLAFGAEIDRDPFAKMLLLGDTLTRFLNESRA